MTQNLQKPDYIFEASWEVCNKVGGIYTVLSSRAHILKDEFGDNLIFIGPDINPDKENADFREDKRLLRSLKKAAAAEGINIRTGRWAVEGNPIAILIDFRPFFEQKNDIYSRAWNLFGVNSLQAYGDYDEASMFSYAAGMLVKCATAQDAFKEKRIVYQAHEWMTGLGMMFLKAEAPQVATIFTTHATSIGRSIAGNNKLLYKYFHGYNGDQMASELSMEAKHSVEKKAAHYADCFTTVSSFTDRECRQLLEKAADVVLPNGFERSARPMSPVAQSRHILLDTASALIGEVLPADTFIISTSGRNDYRCKGFDVYLESLAQLSARLREEAPQKRVLALIEVPCWVKEPRKDLLEQLRQQNVFSLNDVQYCIVETNGALSVLEKPEKRLPNAEEAGVVIPDKKLETVVISDGKLLRESLALCQSSEKHIRKLLASNQIAIEAVFLMTMDGSGDYRIIRKEST